jgi:hypothetical protein
MILSSKYEMDLGDGGHLKWSKIEDTVEVENVDLNLGSNVFLRWSKDEQGNIHGAYIIHPKQGVPSMP